MCGRYTLHQGAEQIAARFAAETPTLVESRYNIAPTQAVPVIAGDETRRLEFYKWGLIPSWASGPSVGSRMINARAETLAEKPSFRTALLRRRCLLPADGFYEWREADNPDEGGRTPMHIRRRDGALFAFAGLWDEWRGPDGVPLRSCTIITTTPNTLLAPIHDRMPIILSRDAEDLWLDSSLHDLGVLQGLLVSPPASEMEAYPVSRRVNAPGVDDPGNIIPIAS